MNKRIRSVSLMSGLQPFIQGKIIKPAQAQAIVEDYKNGNSEKLRSLVFSPDLPMVYEPIRKNLEQFI
jgi:hypothetical protein